VAGNKSSVGRMQDRWATIHFRADASDILEAVTLKKVTPVTDCFPDPRIELKVY
jgi:hypothetical protein